MIQGRVPLQIPLGLDSDLMGFGLIGYRLKAKAFRVLAVRARL